MKSEKAFMEALLSYLQPLGDVLEIGDWETELPKLGVFDTIVIPGYPQDQSMSETVSPKELEEAQVLISGHKKIMGEIKETVPELSGIRYADEDLDQFCQTIGKTQPKQLACFLNELEKNRQITKLQYENLVKKFQLSSKKSTAALINFWKHPKQLISFLKLCMNSHLRKNGRVACFLNTTLYENPQFFEEIITNPRVDYQEKFFKVNDSKALAMILKYP